MGINLVEDLQISDLLDYIDWTPFFHAWDLHGKYPKILNDEKVGSEAKVLLKDAKYMLKKIIDENLLSINGVYGIFPANSENESINIFSEINPKQKLETLIHIRQQIIKRKGQFNYCLSDFIKSNGDYVGAFAVMVGPEVKSICEKFESEQDDYSSIMIKVLADRLAEAYAEKLHEDVRKNYWGYEKDENLTNDELINEKYYGIRPAPGYPACPDHTEKEKLFRLLNVTKNIGLKLTENFAMYPVSAVCGWYFSHPESKYFSIGKIQNDQVNQISKLKNWNKNKTEKWLSPILGYIKESYK